MNPDLVLGVMGALTGFVLKTALAFGVCLGLSWLVCLVSCVEFSVVWY